MRLVLLNLALLVCFGALVHDVHRSVAAEPRPALFADGSRDASPELQKLIDAGSKPLGSIRTGTGEVVIPPGVYRLDNPLKVSGVESFRLSGPGARLTPGKPGMTCLLDLDGVAYSHFSDLRFDAGPGDVQRVVHLRKSPKAMRTTMNTLSNIHIGGLKYVEGIVIGEPGSVQQEDHTTLIGCSAVGQWKPGETKWWRSGFTIGSGRFANNLVHTATGCHSYNNRFNWTVASSQLALNGGGLGGAEADILAYVTSYLSAQGLRSEGSQRLLTTTDTDKVYGWVSHISLSDICFRAEALHPDNQLIRHTTGGHVSIRNLYVHAGDTSKLTVTHLGQYDASLSVDGFSTGPEATNGKRFVGWKDVDVRGVHTTDMADKARLVN